MDSMNLKQHGHCNKQTLKELFSRTKSWDHKYYWTCTIEVNISYLLDHALLCIYTGSNSSNYLEILKINFDITSNLSWRVTLFTL